MSAKDSGASGGPLEGTRPVLRRITSGSAWWAWPLGILAIGLLGFWAWNQLDGPRLGADLITSASVIAGEVHLEGAVLVGNAPVPGARVWALLTEEGSDNRFVSSLATTDPSGRFSLSVRVADVQLGAPSDSLALPDTLPFAPWRGLATVRASGTLDTASVSVVDELRIGAGGVQGQEGVFAWFWILPLLFLATLVMGIFFDPQHASIQYAVTVISALVLTAVMIIGLGFAMRELSQADRDVPLNFGFATIYWGRYDTDVPRQWIVSLTEAVPGSVGAPSLPADGEVVASGFGAPVWIVLLAVLGASVFTISIAVNHLDGEDAADELRKRIKKIVTHQFYILSSPLGAVAVYQLMLTMDTVQNHATVALAGLGSGLIISVLIEKAVTIAATAVK